MFIFSVPVIPSMPIGRFLRHGHIFHPVGVLICHSCAIICNSLVLWLLHSSLLSHNVKKLYIPVNLLYSGDWGGIHRRRSHLWICTSDNYQFLSRVPDGDGGFRRSSPQRGSPPFSGANAGSTLRPRPGWSFECGSWAGVSIKTFFTAHRVPHSTCRE